MALTVKELIDKLSLYPEDARVILSGCDCYGYAEDVRESQDLVSGTFEDVVLIERGS